MAVKFIRAANPIWFFLDFSGLALNDEYYAFFLSNTFPYLPQAVYQDNQGINAWTDPIQFSMGGALPDNLYFETDEVWRIEIRHGNTQQDQLIYVINNFNPGDGINPGPSGSTVPLQNQISNPQFSIVSFTSPLTITTSGTYDIAPGWQLVLTGSGPATATLTQVSFDGNSKIITNPAYALQINNNGWTTATLVQTFENLGGIWTSNDDKANYVTACLTGESDSIDQPITINYVPSNGSPVPSIATGMLLNDDYTVIAGNILMPQSDNLDPAATANVQIQIVLPPTGIVRITNIQVLGEDTGVTLNYEQTTVERQTDQLFHYYEDSLLTQPKKNMVVGWNFRQNPFQMGTASLNITTPFVGSTTPIYVADQTIVRADTVNSINISRTTNPDGFLNITAINAQTQGQIAVFQYIDSKSISQFFGYYFSMMVRAAITTAHSTSIKVKVRVFTCVGDPATLSSTDPITGFDSNNDPIFASAYTVQTPLNDVFYELQPNAGINTLPKMAFNRISVNPNTTDTNVTVGVMLYTVGVLNNTSVQDSIQIESISFIPNDFALDATPQTYDEVLRECQYYYEKSYISGVYPGAINNDGIQLEHATLSSNFPAEGIPYILNLASFTCDLQQTKRTNSYTVNLYSPTLATPDLVEIGILRSGSYAAAAFSFTNPTTVASSNWTLELQSEQKFTYIANDTSTSQTETATPTVGDEAVMIYHYTADDRLGR